MASLACALFYYALWISLNSLCRERSREQVAVVVSQYPDWPELALIDRACDQYLKGYLMGLGLPRSSQVSLGRDYERAADNLVAGSQFARCMERLNDRTCFFEYVLELPFLAEACERCAVSQCRRHTDEAKKRFQKSLKGERRAQVAELRQSCLLLAEQTEDLASLFCRHQKLELADRAYQDAIASATFAADLKDVGEKDAMNLQRFYLAYAAFLRASDRGEEALSTLDTMNRMCGQ
jgi:tetratricopeptide (TPR) repeat protein